MAQQTDADTNRFSEVDFDDDSPLTILKDHGFFPYSGADGDLFRKNGFAGWRVSVYGRYYVRIQKKNDRGTWVTQEQWENDNHEQLTSEQLAEFDAELEELV